MRVLVLTAAFPNNVWPNHGVFVKERMAHFGRLPGCEIRVVAPVPYYPPIKVGSRWRYSQVRKHEIIEGIPVSHPRYLVIPGIGMSTHGWTMYRAGLGAIRRIRREWDFDLISAHTVYPDGLAGVLLGRKFDKPVVVSARGTDINLFPQFKRIRPLIQQTLSGADRSIAVCQALKDVMTTLGTPDERVAVVPNGIDPEKFHASDKQTARAKLKLPSDSRIIISVGELIPRKGFHRLIRALSILAREKETRDLRLIIVGEGAFRHELESLVRSLDLDESVRLIGAIRHQELLEWYSAADLFCLVSSREGWPNVMVEALACGLPVVATNVWGHPDILHSEKLGLLTDQDEESIAKTIAEAFKRQWDPPEIARCASERTWKRVAGEMNEVFASVLANRTAG